jgi:hypothetical protein
VRYLKSVFCVEGLKQSKEQEELKGVKNDTDQQKARNVEECHSLWFWEVFVISQLGLFWWIGPLGVGQRHQTM